MKGDILENILIEDLAAEGKCIARHEGKVIFVKFAVPGDLVDLRIIYEKKKYAEAEIVRLHKYSADRAEIACKHFTVCGGCAWQHLKYEKQIEQKEQQVKDAFERIAKISYSGFTAIKGCNEIYEYRNKLDFSFSNKRWLLWNEPFDENKSMDALGFHVPGRFDKVLDVEECRLMDERNNRIRNFTRTFCMTNNYTFFDLVKQQGFMRNLIIRNSSAGGWMCIFIFAENDEEKIRALLDAVKKEFPFISSLLYSVNQKRNDSIYDLDIECYAGEPWIIEEMDTLKFKIRPKSFFQTNSKQALNLYRIALDYAGLSGNENVYDLYTGTGTIANFMAGKARHVLGIDSVPQAIEDAKENSQMNGITNTTFLAGDMKDIFNNEIRYRYGEPDVVITDPPRAGMHEKVVRQLLNSGAKRIVYVSCNPATQARDLEMLSETYAVSAVRPVDMFPHTHHVENVALLVRKEVYL